ncbi:MAG: ABC transporter ATP-binding protein [Eubacteriales bacterium]|nr:ABC transporter ATP-binding protein [Eubacteriales bacterium]
MDHIKRLFKYIRKFAFRYILASLLLITAVVLDMFYPRISRTIIDDIITGGRTDLLKPVLGMFAALCLARAVTGYLKELSFDVASIRAAAVIREDLFKHIQSLSFSFFDRTNTGELMSRIKEDVEHIWHVICFGSMLLLENIIYFTVASAILFSLNWKLAAASVGIMPFIAFIAVKLEKKLHASFARLSDQRALINTTAQENLTGVRLVKAFGREKHEICKFLGQNKENLRLNVEQADIISKHYPKIEFLSNMAAAIITTVGGILVIGEEISLGTLVAFSGYIFMLVWPMRMIGWLINLFAECRASLEKIGKIFEEKPDIENPESPVSPVSRKGHVIFRDVCFEYGGIPVLKNISFEAGPGSTVALMGLTGSGKSSVINLIPRYYDCSSGSVEVDGVDVKLQDLNELRGRISVVMQDTFLFSDTIRENIKFGMDEISDDDFHEAARESRVGEFAENMPAGYDSVIGERGIGLSGGQKQRISIARALARDCDIMIFDDATSALDMETEHRIQEAVGKREGVTKFIIAHRISAVKNADEIIIIENGEIAERGTHRELLHKKGLYYKTYSEQYKGLVSIGDDDMTGHDSAVHEKTGHDMGLHEGAGDASTGDTGAEHDSAGHDSAGRDNTGGDKIAD